MSEVVIRAEALTKRFVTGRLRRRSIEAVADLTFEVRRGEIFAFLGPNGAGKTTTINLLMGFLRPTRGCAFVLGHPAGAREARQRIGYLPEGYAFYTAFTAPILLDIFGRFFRLPVAERRTRIERILKDFDLWRARTLPIGKYSRGMRQCLGLAQALVNDPKLLILDEPTSGLDPRGRRMVRELLLRYKSEGATVFLCSHILSEVETICDRVAILDRGRIVREGTLKELIGGHRGYEIRFAPIERMMLDRVRALGANVELVEGECRTFVTDELLAQRIVEVVRSSGGVLKAYIPTMRTLEEVFLELTGRYLAPSSSEEA